MRVSYSPGYYASIPHGHIFPMRKFDGLYRYLAENDIIAASDVICPREADLASLLLVHTSRYLDGILNGNLGKREERRIGLPWSPSLARRSRLAVQGTINAALMALEDGISGNLAGGTHHAFPDHGEGFCVFNDVCVAVRTLKQALWVRNVLIIDLDVHHGNGTAKYFSNDPDVYTFSMHGEKNFPFTKPSSTFDIGLPDRTGDNIYLRTLENALGSIFGSFKPDLVFYLGGIDPLETDHFGRLSLSLKGLRKREEMVVRAVRELDIPLVLLLSGGYAPTLNETVTAHAMMYKVAKGLV